MCQELLDFSLGILYPRIYDFSQLLMAQVIFLPTILKFIEKLIKNMNIYIYPKINKNKFNYITCFINQLISSKCKIYDNTPVPTMRKIYSFTFIQSTAYFSYKRICSLGF